MRKIFLEGLVTLGAAVTVNLLAIAGKKNYTAEVVDGANTYTPCDESGKVKKFTDENSAAKFLGKFGGETTVLTINIPDGKYAPTAAAGDPSTALANEKVKLNGQIAKATATMTKAQSDVDAATALGWATGSAAQQALLHEEQTRVTLIGDMKTALQAKLAALPA
ncbi:hypothetical protein LPB67_15420 [Undibacterium sp. Jales W-56]|uniref:hypothetical protein n=1 Tax=Undibacterium sp. Jales W-56 TaxID=2897325 RepID=UPI0021D0FDA0|nr:hypothetical protein [Undibacterium sp. Jales W-56]MCU6435166.1 hypothetical protein [Undibacterium sp. Jales W-56]